MKTVLGVSLLALTLAACGGGGGGDSSSSNNEETTHQYQKLKSKVFTLERPIKNRT